MNNGTALIPIDPDFAEIQEMINDRQRFGLSKLAALTADELRKLQREWYDLAVKNNVITLLQILLMQAGKPDGTGNTMTWEQEGILATYDLASSSLMIRVNGFLVCATYSKGNEVFVPGQWLKTAMAALDRVEIENKREVENFELGQRRDLVTLLGAKV